ncbi:hypothetical protein BpHYR1_047790 [Brachionus plicatilis]|uniref:Uncharacterized protein n=1 Tax=Brachionus plicatilis TaxID=10195 RepID=A0A3M7S952_BRAPC|nr:hypothetical protein BpHYR1_047790 [Brachionus plicatilis]
MSDHMRIPTQCQCQTDLSCWSTGISFSILILIFKKFKEEKFFYKMALFWFKISFVNATWCNIQSCIYCQSLLMMCKFSAKCTTLEHIEI